MIFSTLFVASVAFAQTYDSVLSYYSPNSTCQGAPEVLTMSDRGYAGNCNSPRECLNRFSGFGRNDVGYYVCNPSASKIVEDVFGSTPYVVFETYVDDQCSKLDRIYVYKANNICIPHVFSNAYSFNQNGISISKGCNEVFTIPSNFLSKTACRSPKDVGGDITFLHNMDFNAGVRVYTSAQGPPSNPPKNPTTSSTSGTNSPATSTSVTNPTGKPTTTSNPSLSSAWGIAASLPIVLAVSVFHLFQ